VRADWRGYLILAVFVAADIAAILFAVWLAGH
jgi:hypothetical protein